MPLLELTENMIKVAGMGDAPVVKSLLNRGANVNGTDVSGLTALMAAAAANSFRTMNDLMEAGAVLDAKNKQGFTALMCAAQSGAEDAVRFLIEKGSSLEEKNNAGETAESLARAGGHSRVADILHVKNALDRAAAHRKCLRRLMPKSRLKL